MLNIKKTLSKILTNLVALNTDYIIEEGTSGNWRYRKWKSGKIEAWGYQYYSSISINIASSAYGGYRSDVISMTIPSGIFTVAPDYVFLQKKTSQSGSIYFGSGTSATNIQFIMGGVAGSAQTITSQTILAYAVQV